MKLLRILKQLVGPLLFLIVLAVSTVVFAKLRILIYETELHVDSEIDMYSDTFYAAIERSGKALLPGNTTTASLATSLASSFNDSSALSFSTILTKVGPTLFLAVSAIPKLSQASFASPDGLFLSFYKEDKDRIFTVYSNSTTPFSPTWFTQPVNHDTGEPYGVAVESKSMLTKNTQWFQAGLASDGVVSSMGRSWKNDKEGMFLSTVSVHGQGVISLGYATKVVVDHFAALNSRGLYLQLATQDGEVVVRPTGEAAVVIERFGDGVLTVRNVVSGEVANLSCDSAESAARSLGEKVVGGTFYCSTLTIGGVNMVYVVAYPGSGLMSLVIRITRASTILVGVLFAMVVLSLGLFLWMATRATKRELYLCASLIKQTEATQQAERKSMNKTRIFAGISHDVRNALAQLVALIKFSQEETIDLDAKIARDLEKVEKCAHDAIGMLESVLDINKLESGKLELKNEDFNLANLLDELVDRFFDLGIKKGVDVVFDPSDAFIYKSSHVLGDQTRLKQILSNLLSNAIKFTSEGHVKVRATVRKKNLRNHIINSNRTFAFASLLSSCCWDKCGVNGESELDTLQMMGVEDPNEVEFEFEVDDTGKGIPKDEWKSVFEDYVQATNNNSSHSGGFGLGLGNVQSLVRLMKGELQIVEKEQGEKGTCFKFNVFLSTPTPTMEGQPQQQQQRPSLTFRPPLTLTSPKGEDSQVIILIEGEERRKVLKKYIENMNIKVIIISHPRSLCQELEKIRVKLETSSPAAATSQAQHLSRSVSNGSDSLRRNNIRTANPSKSSLSKFILLVIDVKYHRELHNSLLEFKRGAPHNNASWKIVWVHDRFMIQNGDEHSRLLQETLTSGGDYVVYKPLHGSRVTEILSLLPGRNKGILPHSNANTLTPPTALHFQRVPSNNSNCWTIDLGDTVHCMASSESVSTILQEAVLVNSDVSGHEEINKQRLKGKKVLVVDDDMLLRKLHERMMSKIGASSVEVCKNGKEALDKVTSALREQSEEENHQSLVPYECILMDCEMPEMNGYEATRLIRAEEERHGQAGRIPIVAISGHSSPEEMSRSLEAGMDFHLIKPLKESQLLDVVRNIDAMRSRSKDD